MIISGGKGGCARTFSGCETIMWQSMKMPGTPLDTQARMGAPLAYMRTISRVKQKCGRTHGDVRYEMTTGAGYQRGEALLNIESNHPSMTSAIYSVNHAL